MSAAIVIPMSDASEAITDADVSPTVLPDAFLSSALAEGVRALKIPRFDELSEVPLYREQVIAYIEGVFAPLDGCIESSWLTPAMVNNYVKSHLIAAPVKKLYGREQIARLIVICVFKQVLPIASIAKLFRIQRMTYRTATAYDYVATELEHALRTAFSEAGYQEPDSATRVTRESLLVRGAVTAFAARAHLMGYLSYLGYEEG